MQGGIISAALGLIKDKEKQADKASERLHDGMKTQMELTANQGSWTGEQSGTPAKVVKEKVVEKEKVKEPEDEKDKEESASPAVGASSSDEDKKKNFADMSIIDLAKGASK